LEAALLHALTVLPRAKAAGMPVGRVWNIPARPAGLTGRDGLLADLRAALHATTERWCARCMASRGGKTTMAIEYAHRFAADYDGTGPRPGPGRPH
jgi:hypothetical protein